MKENVSGCFCSEHIVYNKLTNFCFLSLTTALFIISNLSDVV